MGIIKRLISKYFDYDIVGEYYDRLPNGHLKKKYKKRWKLRKRGRK